MMRLFLLPLVMVSLLAASGYIDSDLDGVEDSRDQCPNTPLTDLVDESGCSVESLVSPHRLALYLGLSRHPGNLTQTLQVDYAEGAFSTQLYGAFDYETDYDQSGFNDTYLWAWYAFYPIENLQLKPGVGLILPTYRPEGETNRLDVALSLTLNYLIGEWNPYAVYTLTVVRDDSQIYDYRDTMQAWDIGVGRFIRDFYLSAAFHWSQNLYRDATQISSISLDGVWFVDSHWLVTLTWLRGLEGMAYENYFAMQVGYEF